MQLTGKLRMYMRYSRKNNRKNNRYLFLFNGHHFTGRLFVFRFHFMQSMHILFRIILIMD